MKFTTSTLFALLAITASPAVADSFAFGPMVLKVSSTSSGRDGTLTSAAARQQSVTTSTSTSLSAAAGGPTPGGRKPAAAPDNFSLSPDEYKAFSRFGEDMLKQAFPKMSETDMKAVSRFGNELFKPVLRNYVPGYEVIDDDDKFQVQVDVPGVDADDLTISLEDDDTVLTLSGSRQKFRDGESYRSDFSESFEVDPTVVDTEKLSADLQNGVLVVTAPKKQRVVVSSKKTIPITQMGRSPPSAAAAGTPSSTSSSTPPASIDADVEQQPSPEEETPNTSGRDIPFSY